MIVKEFDAPIPDGAMRVAGHNAEKQMAYYLRRSFSESSDIFVFNDLRLERAGEIAQIDHLVMHRFGFVIIESKSVTTTVTVNEHGEFTRSFRGRKKGMPSPISQAYRQRDLVQLLLSDNKEQLRGKFLFGMKQGGFHIDRFLVLVAISDHGIIERHGIDPPELKKADAITAAISQRIADHDAATGVRGFVNFARANLVDQQEANRIMELDLPRFKDDEMQAMTKFLLENNNSNPSSEEILDAEVIDAEIVDLEEHENQVEEVTTSTPICKKCESSDLRIQYGKYGYYFKCKQCKANSPIDFKCSQCDSKAKIKKSGLNFTKVCQHCDLSVPFFSNGD